MNVKEVKEALEGLAESLADMFSQFVEKLRDSGLPELCSAAYLARTLRENPSLTELETHFARATREGRRMFRIRTTGPKEYDFRLEVTHD